MANRTFGDSEEKQFPQPTNAGTDYLVFNNTKATLRVDLNNANAANRDVVLIMEPGAVSGYSVTTSGTTNVTARAIHNVSLRNEPFISFSNQGLNESGTPNVGTARIILTIT